MSDSSLSIIPASIRLQDSLVPVNMMTDSGTTQSTLSCPAQSTLPCFSQSTPSSNSFMADTLTISHDKNYPSLLSQRDKPEERSRAPSRTTIGPCPPIQFSNTIQVLALLPKKPTVQDEIQSFTSEPPCFDPVLTKNSNSHDPENSYSTQDNLLPHEGPVYTPDNLDLKKSTVLTKNSNSHDPENSYSTQDNLLPHEGPVYTPDNLDLKKSNAEECQDSPFYGHSEITKTLDSAPWPLCRSNSPISSCSTVPTMKAENVFDHESKPHHNHPKKPGP